MAGPGISSRKSHERRVRRGTKAVGVGAPQLVEIQRARMLASTFDVLRERGAANVSIAHIVARSGVSRRTFYELFESREDCFLAAFEDALALATACVFTVCAREQNWRVRVRAGLVALLGFLDEEPAMAHMLVVASLSAGPRTLERRRQVLAGLAEVVDEARSSSSNAELLPSLTADGLVGGALSLIHMRIAGPGEGSLLELTNQLMSMIVLPYLGSAAARRELDCPVDPRVTDRRESRLSSDPFKDAGMRLTYRTVRVLLAIAEHPGASNRTIGDAAEIRDQGQISKLMNRLQRLELVSNSGLGPGTGAPNAWSLTTTGEQMLASFRSHTEITPHGAHQGEASSC
ncbi:MAG: TetR family transcriptional regulator [Solirubrobacteraceae bacterium]